MLATILSLAFVLSVLTTAFSLDSHERRGNDASGPTEKQLHSVLKKCQPKQEPADAATGFAHGGIPHEHFATVVPFIEGYRDEGGCDALLNDEHKETGGVNASVSSSGQASHQRL